MKKNLILICLWCINLVVNAQFAIVSDPDGSVNVRDSASTKADIIKTIPNHSIVYITDSVGNWDEILFSFGEDLVYGFVYSNRLKKMENLEKLQSKSKNANQLIIANNHLMITLTRKSFLKKNHKLFYSDGSNGSPKFIETIDDKPFFGTDGSIPKFEYQSIEILWDKTKITLPKSSYDDLFEPDFNATQAFYDSKNDVLYIHATNGVVDRYSVVWCIKKKKYKTRLVVSGS